VFCYCSLGGDTALPDGLYAGLCHAFLVLFYRNLTLVFCLGCVLKFQEDIACGIVDITHYCKL